MPGGNLSEALMLASMPARSQAAVVASNTVDIPRGASRIYVGVGGDVAFIAADDTAAVTWKAVPTGSVMPVLAKRVMVTGTTATDMVAF